MLQQDLPAGPEISYFLDTTEFVKVAIEEVFHALRDAIILVLIVVFIFLGNIRDSFPCWRCPFPQWHVRVRSRCWASRSIRSRCWQSCSRSESSWMTPS